MLVRQLARGTVIAVLFTAAMAYAGTVSIATPSASAGSTTTVIGSGFTPRELVDLRLDGATVGFAAANQDGAFIRDVIVPSTTAVGQHELKAVSRSSGDSTQSFINVFASWSMFKNQPTHLSTNPLEFIINPGNARNLSLAWVGIMPALVDESSPAVVNGVVYIGSTDGNLYAFNANGCGSQACNPLWVGSMDNQFFTVSSPAVANGTVFIGSADHKLFAFAAAGCGHNTCSPLWTGTTQAAIDSAPVVANGVVYIGSEDHKLYAFRATGCGSSTCPPLWVVNTGAGVNSSPAVANGVVYFGSQDGKLYAVNANGCGRLICQPLWTAQVGTMVFGSSPAVANGVVYISSFIEADGSSSNLYVFSAGGCGHNTCPPLWTAPDGDFVVSSPAVSNGMVYIGSGDDLLYAFNANGCGQSTCTFVWRGEGVGEQAGLVSSPAVANGVVYVGENNGFVEVFNANGCGGDSLCLPLAQLATNNEQIVSSSPAVVNGTVYFGSADEANPPIGRLYVYKLTR